MTPAIIAEDIHKGFHTGSRHTPILKGVSLEVARGETVFLVGPSGSGKTTLLSILGCILTPDKGAVQVLGEDVTRKNVGELAAFRREHLGFIFQSFNLFPTLNALDNVSLALTMRGVGVREARARAADLLQQVQLGHRLYLRPAQLSTGECQRVAVARALVNNPALLFADEPTASLDAENGRAAMHLLSRLATNRGMTLVVVTHDSRIFSFSDRILQLEDGLLTGEWDPMEEPVGPAQRLARQMKFLKKESVA
jgi:putative ABC transport system ATP-binding protein